MYSILIKNNSRKGVAVICHHYQLIVFSNKAVCPEKTKSMASLISMLKKTRPNMLSYDRDLPTTKDKRIRRAVANANSVSGKNKT